MSIYIPPKADPDLLRSLRDIEQKLNELSRDTGPTAPVTDGSVLSRLDVLEDRINTLNQFERVSQPFANYKNDGNPSRVLHEDGTWMEPLAGIAKAVPPSLDSSRTRPTNMLNVLGSLAVTGALSADTVRARLSRIHVRGAMVTRSTDLAVTASTPVAVTFDTEVWDTDGFWNPLSADATPIGYKITVPAGMGGYYMASGAGRFSSHVEGAGPWHTLRIEKNSNNTPNANNIIGEITARDGNGQVWQHAVITPVLYLAAGDEVELVVNAGHNDTLTAVTAAVTDVPYLQLVYLGA